MPISKGNQGEHLTAAGKLFCCSLGIGNRGTHGRDRSFLMGRFGFRRLPSPYGSLCKGKGRGYNMNIIVQQLL